MFAHDHMHEVDRVIAGHSSSVDEIVKASWLRCAKQHNLNPGLPNRATHRTRGDFTTTSRKHRTSDFGSAK